MLDECEWGKVKQDEPLMGLMHEFIKRVTCIVLLQFRFDDKTQDAWNILSHYWMVMTEWFNVFESVQQNTAQLYHIQCFTFLLKQDLTKMGTIN